MVKLPERASFIKLSIACPHGREFQWCMSTAPGHYGETWTEKIATFEAEQMWREGDREWIRYELTCGSACPPLRVVDAKVEVLLMVLGAPGRTGLFPLNFGEAKMALDHPEEASSELMRRHTGAAAPNDVDLR